MPLSPRQSVEMFHLVFLRALVARGDDKRRFVLKGGCNLRFYFGSVRHSEDIDFDVSIMARETLRKKVGRLLRSPLVTSPLRAKAITIVDVSSPKQTDTTQRWKAGLSVDGLAAPLRTKIEFSRRDGLEDTAFEAIDRQVLRPYALPAFLATHYTTSGAIAQKIRALAGRAEPQARDVFDLAQLLARADAERVALAEADKRRLPEAIDRATSLSFDDYASQVVAYLAPEQADLFRERTAWKAMQSDVVAKLGELR